MEHHNQKVMGVQRTNSRRATVDPAYATRTRGVDIATCRAVREVRALLRAIVYNLILSSRVLYSFDYTCCAHDQLAAMKVSCGKE